MARMAADPRDPALVGVDDADAAAARWPRRGRVVAPSRRSSTPTGRRGRHRAAWRIPDGRGPRAGHRHRGCGGIVQYGHLPAYRPRACASSPLRTWTPSGPGPSRTSSASRTVAAAAEELVRAAGRGHRGHRGAALGPAGDRGAGRRAGRHMLCQKPFALELDAAGGWWRRRRRRASCSRSTSRCAGTPASRPAATWSAGGDRPAQRRPDRGLGRDGLASLAVARGGAAARDHVPQHPLPRLAAIGAGGPGVGHQRPRPVPGAGPRPGRDAHDDAAGLCGRAPGAGGREPLQPARHARTPSSGSWAPRARSRARSG